MNTAFIKTNSKKGKLLTQCPLSNAAPIFQLPNGRPKSNYLKKDVGSEVLRDVVKRTSKNLFLLIQQSIPKVTNMKDPRTESPNSDDTRNANKKTSTKDIEKIFVVEDNMVNHVQKWDITKRIDNKKKIYVRQYSRSKLIL